MAVKNCCYVAICSAARGASAPIGDERGGGISWRPPAYSLFVTESTRERERAYLQQRLNNTNMMIVPRPRRKEISLRYTYKLFKNTVENLPQSATACIVCQYTLLESFIFYDCNFLYIHCFVHVMKLNYLLLPIILMKQSYGQWNTNMRSKATALK